AAWCRYCCKSPKLPGANFPAVKKSDRRPLIRVPSIALPRSSASLSSGDEVPHIFTRKSRLKPGKFLITSAKRLLQQYLPTADQCIAANTKASNVESAAQRNHPFSSRLSSFQTRQSDPSARILFGVDLIMPASRRRSE